MNEVQRLRKIIKKEKIKIVESNKIINCALKDLLEIKMAYNKKDKKKIAEVAYRKWQEDGSPQSDGKKYWLEAEQELTKADVQLEEIEIELYYDNIRSLK
jgi:hypothetical protein